MGFSWPFVLVGALVPRLAPSQDSPTSSCLLEGREVDAGSNLGTTLGARSRGNRLMQVKADMRTISSASALFGKQLAATTMRPLSWRSIREFKPIPLRQSTRCNNVGRQFPELVSRNHSLLDSYDAYACGAGKETFLVDPTVGMSVQLAELASGCINMKPWPKMRFAGNGSHGEFLYRSCSKTCLKEHGDERVEEVDVDVLVLPSWRLIPGMEYQHTLLDFLAPAWTTLGFLKSSSAKVLSKHPFQTEILRQLGLGAAKVLELPMGATDEDPVLCTKPGRTLHLWRVADGNRNGLQMFAYGDGRTYGDFWHRLIMYQIRDEFSHVLARQLTLPESQQARRVIFLQRCTQRRPIFNEQAALAMTSRVLMDSNRSEELLSYCAGRLRLVDQMKEMHSARLAIGEHGGALSNLIFTQSDAGVIEFVGSPEAHVGIPGFWPPYKSFWYGGAGAAFSFYKVVIYEPDPAGEWNVRLEDLQKAVQEWAAEDWLPQS